MKLYTLSFAYNLVPVTRTYKTKGAAKSAAARLCHAYGNPNGNYLAFIDGPGAELRGERTNGRYSWF